MAWTPDERVRGGYPDPSLLALSGLDRMKASFRRQMLPPPIHHLFGLTPVSASPAAVTFSMPCSPWLQTDAAVFFAGTAALIADAPLGSAILVALGPGQYAVTSDLTVNFLRPVTTASGQLIARCRPIEVGRSLGLAEGLVEDGQGRLVAHCTTRCFITTVDAQPLPGPPPEVEQPLYDSPDPYLRPVPEGSVIPELWDDRASVLEVAKAREAMEAPPPPFASLFGMDGVGGEEGRFWCSIPASPWFTSPAGTVYGGVLAYVLDSALTGALSTTLSVGEITAALDLKVQFLRPVWPDGRRLKIEGAVDHRGRSFATAHAEITNEDGKVVAVGSSSVTIRKGSTWSSLVVADEAVLPADPSAPGPSVSAS